MRDILVTVSDVKLVIPENHPQLQRIVKFFDVVTHIDINLENQTKISLIDGVVYVFNLTYEQFEQWKSWVVYENIQWKYASC